LAGDGFAGLRSNVPMVQVISRRARGYSRAFSGYPGQMTKTLEEQLIKHLTDVHSIEEQALQQLRKAPDIAGGEKLATAFREHLTETEDQERRVRERLEAHGGDPSRTKDLVARAGGIGMLLFARSQPDTPGKLTAHAYSYEHMELAAYDLLALVAERAGDRETAEVARSIREQEAAMAERLAAGFDEAVEASLGDDDPAEALTGYLADAHAIEAQAIQLLEKGPSIAGQPELAKVFSDHLEETRSQQTRVETRLEAHEASPSRLKDAVMSVGALNLGAFFGAQPDTPAKLAGFAFAFEHLEIAGYEQLKRVAQRAGDSETARVAEAIITEEHAAAAAIRAQFERAVEASLEKQTAAAGA
jgi:ferritin-like metal-binding protein YciE